MKEEVIRPVPAMDHVGPPLLEARDLRRTFGETIALDSCSITVARGEIHAVVGENGSGKSTLIKILSGIVPAESGTLSWDGAPVVFRTPGAAQSAGVATVFQETLILLDMSVRDNVMLGLDGVFRRKASPTREAVLVREALAVVGLGQIDIERLAGTLTLANRQLVAVARSLMRPWRLLILDESTSAIDIEDRNRLFAALRAFRDGGRSILFVSHRMDEIESLADRATVLRSGKSVATLATGAFSSEALLGLMSPERTSTVTHQAKLASRPADGAPVMRVRGFALKPDRPAFDFDLGPGEIVGLGGLEGHGQVAFLECMAGLRRLPAGRVETGGIVVRGRRDTERNGVAYLPRDRKTEGIFATLSVIDNITISSLRKLSAWGILWPSARRRAAEAMVVRTRVRMTSPYLPIASLSGGNQQKALLGRLIATEPRVLLLNDPLRGVDLGAKRELYDVLTGLAAEGIAILFLSTELVELTLLCNRVVVFHDNAVAAVIERADLDERSLIAAMFGKVGPQAVATMSAP